MIVPDQYAITRTPTVEDPQPKILGMAGDRYHVLQNRQIAEILEPISQLYPVESCAALHDGAVVFFSLRDARSSDVGGEEIVNYFVVTDSKDGKQKARMIYTPVRVVCQNTLSAGINAASVNVEFPHRRNAASDMEFHARFILEIERTQNAVLDRMRRMTEVQLNSEAVQTIIESA